MVGAGPAGCACIYELAFANRSAGGFAMKALRALRYSIDNLVFDFAPVLLGYGWIFPKRDDVTIGLYCIDPSKDLSRAPLSITSSTALGIM